MENQRDEHRLRKVVRHIVGPPWGICEEEMILERERERGRLWHRPELCGGLHVKR